MTELNVDDDGFLLNPEDWTEEIAEYIAKNENIELTEERWMLIKIIRDYYAYYGAVPELRKILKQLKEEIGPEKATRKYVYSLFPYGYGQQGCKIAGMRQPKKLWLDL